MPVWFLVLLLAALAFAVLLSVGMAYSRRSAGQNTTIIGRRPSSESRSTTVADSD